MVMALRRPVFLAGLRSSMMRSDGAVGEVCAEFVVMIGVVVVAAVVVVVCGLWYGERRSASNSSFHFLHRAPVCRPHEASACFCHCQFGRLLEHANHG